MEIKRENVVKAYMAGDNNVKEMLRTMFPDIDFEAEERPVTERIKTFEDARRELGYDNPFVVAYNTIQDCTYVEEEVEKAHDLIAFLKLRIICAALNEGWEPQFTENEWRWYPWHILWTEEELTYKKEERDLIGTSYYKQEGFAGFACASSSTTPSNRNINLGSRLCLKSEALADYCGKQFIELWADFKLIRHK